MSKAQLRLISFDSRSVGLARVCLALAKTDSKAAWQVATGKTIGTDLNLSSLGHSIFNQAQCPPRLRHQTMPIAEAARRLRGLVQPRFIPLSRLWRFLFNLIATNL